MSTAAIIAPLQLAAGDLLGRTVAAHQPATLAAIEGVTRTEHGAGLNVGGFPLPGHHGDVLNVKVPHLLSLLAFDDPKRAGPRPGHLPLGRPHSAHGTACGWPSSAWSVSAPGSSRSASGIGCAGAAAARRPRTG